MIYIIIIILGIGIFEVRNLLKHQYKKEAIVWISMAVITLAFGIYYLYKPFPDSLSYILLNLFGFEF